MRFFSKRILLLKILRTFFFSFLTTQSLHFVLFSLYSFSFWQQSCFPTATSLLYGIKKSVIYAVAFSLPSLPQSWLTGIVPFYVHILATVSCIQQNFSQFFFISLFLILRKNGSHMF